MSDIVEDNVALMLSSQRKGMMALLNAESVGARGHVIIDGQKCQIMGANFNFDVQTGQIIEFSNSKRPEYGIGLFKIALIAINYRKVKDFSVLEKIVQYPKIIGVIYTDEDKISATAKAVINASMIEYAAAVKVYNAPFMEFIKSAA